MLDRLRPRHGAKHSPKRVGRGPGSGLNNNTTGAIYANFRADEPRKTRRVRDGRSSSGGGFCADSDPSGRNGTLPDDSCSLCILACAARNDAPGPDDTLACWARVRNPAQRLSATGVVAWS